LLIWYFSLLPASELLSLLEEILDYLGSLDRDFEDAETHSSIMRYMVMVQQEADSRQAVVNGLSTWLRTSLKCVAFPNHCAFHLTSSPAQKSVKSVENAALGDLVHWLVALS
jgi:hypothetical protein